MSSAHYTPDVPFIAVINEGQQLALYDIYAHQLELLHRERAKGHPWMIVAHDLESVGSGPVVDYLVQRSYRSRRAATLAYWCWYRWMGERSSVVHRRYIVVAHRDDIGS